MITVNTTLEGEIIKKFIDIDVPVGTAAGTVIDLVNPISNGWAITEMYLTFSATDPTTLDVGLSSQLAADADVLFDGLAVSATTMSRLTEQTNYQMSTNGIGRVPIGALVLNSDGDCDFKGSSRITATIGVVTTVAFKIKGYIEVLDATHKEFDIDGRGNSF